MLKTISVTNLGLSVATSEVLNDCHAGMPGRFSWKIILMIVFADAAPVKCIKKYDPFLNSAKITSNLRPLEEKMQLSSTFLTLVFLLKVDMRFQKARQAGEQVTSLATVQVIHALPNNHPSTSPSKIAIIAFQN